MLPKEIYCIYPFSLRLASLFQSPFGSYSQDWNPSQDCGQDGVVTVSHQNSEVFTRKNVRLPSFSILVCLGIFLCFSITTHSLSSAPRERVKATPQSPNIPPLPWWQSQSWSSDRLGHGHLAMVGLVNPAQLHSYWRQGAGYPTACYLWRPIMAENIFYLTANFLSHVIKYYQDTSHTRQRGFFINCTRNLWWIRLKFTT